MENTSTISKLKDFQELLSISNLVQDALHSIGWIFVRGLTFIIDGMEHITEDILLIKSFFNNNQVVEFVQTIQPFLYVLLAGSFLFTGYLVIFQKKFDREGFLINIFISLLILGLLSPTMQRVDTFTNTAVQSINQDSPYQSKSQTISQKVLQNNVHDLIEYDKDFFENKELAQPNSIPPDQIENIEVNELLDSDEYRLSNVGEDISQNRLAWDGKKMIEQELDQGGVEWNNQYYYRYHINWLTILVTLGVMGFTLFSIAYKLARLSFELAFNYVLAILVAPADLHSGQKTKKVIQSILNTFLVIILIFVSIKIYTIGTAYLADTLDGLPYLIALIAFSAALIDGPNMVERLFGIDAGLKRGWGIALGAYALGKGTAKVGARMVGQTMKSTQRPAAGPSVSEAASTSIPPFPPPPSGGTSQPSPAEERSQEIHRANGTDRSPSQSPCPAEAIDQEQTQSARPSQLNQEKQDSKISAPAIPHEKKTSSPSQSLSTIHPEHTAAVLPTNSSSRQNATLSPSSKEQSLATVDLNKSEGESSTPSSSTQRQRPSIYQELELTTPKAITHQENRSVRNSGYQEEAPRIYSTDAISPAKRKE